MWPWEHLFVGYLLYSVTSRVAYRWLPSEYGVFALAFGTQFPDLVDKPGGWLFGVLPSGTSLAHSVFVAVPVSLLVLLLAWRRGTIDIGIAFSAGYVSHLFGDVLYSVLLGGGPAFNAILWPLAPTPSSATRQIFPYVSYLLDSYLEFLLSPAGVGYVVFETVLVVMTVTLWARDGAPGLRLVRRLGMQIRKVRNPE